ncbi:MAG: hypothetical protein MMC33_005977 [Icmadophila ericetorum]|nr:hypothetical protein [Icmadophila ericetorum]
MNDSARSSSFTSSSFLSRRFNGLKLGQRERVGETSDEVRGPFGLTLLHEPSDPLIDFIFVHGLRGGSRKSWSKTESPAHYWPKEWLPAEPRFRNVRIHTFGYNSDWLERKGSNLTVHDFGQALLGEIQNSPSMGQRGQDTPLVLVGHSMGGLVIKKVLLLAKQNPNYRQIAARIHSMFFLAVPHRGADAARFLNNVLKATISHGAKSYVESLIPNSEAIQIINDEFRHAYHGVQLWSFFETVKTTSLGIIVEKDSAILGLPEERIQLLNADHRHVCKYEDPLDSNYCSLRNAFVFAINSIEKTWLSPRTDEHRSEMKLLSSYLGLLERPEADLASAIERKTEGSCCWLTDKPSFQDWQEGPKNSPTYYWLSGEPATGKSTISGHVTKFLEDSNCDCSYFFFKHGLTGKSTVAELLCSMAWQMALMNTEIRHKLLEIRNDGVSIDKADERSIWRIIFITRIFRTEMRQPNFWVVDAMDECTNFSVLLPLLAKIDKQFPLRMFITSRPSLAIERSFSQEKIPVITTQIEMKTSLDDIKLFLQAHAAYLPVENEVERETLIKNILKKSNGNFLWTSLVVQELEEAHSEQRVHEILDSVPPEIDELYSRIMDQLLAKPANAELAKAILRWVVCASRPLSVEELREALKLDTGQMLLKLDKSAGAICGNLVYVDNQSRVQIAHQTVKEFLFRTDHDSQITMSRHLEHSRIAEICLKYLCGDEMKTPRFRRNTSSARQAKRCAFASYATSYFSEHVARSSSSEDELLIALNSFLQNNAFTWIEVIAKSQDLTSLTQTAKNLRVYLDRRVKYRPSLGIEVQHISKWASDLSHLVAQFGRTLLETPSAIHFLIPPVCPQESIIFRTFKKYPRCLQVVSLSQKEWDHRISCIIVPQAQTLTVTCRDNKFALGFSDGTVRIYQETTFQQQFELSHGEPVRCLVFATGGQYLASAGGRKISLWSTNLGTRLWAVRVADQVLALDFYEDDKTLTAITKASYVGFWEVATGQVVNSSTFSDVDEDFQHRYNHQRSPMYAAFSPGLNLLGVIFRGRPVRFWDLEDNEFVGQFYKSEEVYPAPFIHDFVFNPKPEVNLAAVAYQDGDVVVFDPETQQIVASVDADAIVLAVSPDGTTLATGSGNGVIKLYDFETLTLLHQINSYQQAIRAIAFNSNSLRFFDIRGDHCNIWEPSALVRRIGAGDDSSIDLSERLEDGPQFTTVNAYDEDLAITAMVAHHGGDLIFCGRENGSIAAYSTNTGLCVQELSSHREAVAIKFLVWDELQNLLVIVDIAGRVVVRKLTKIASASFEIDRPSMDKRCSGVVRQVLLSVDGKRLLVSTDEADELWNLEEALLAHKSISILPGFSYRWINHPKDSTKLILVSQFLAKIFDWETLSELSKPEAISLALNPTSLQPLTNLTSSNQCQYICMIFNDPRATDMAPALRIFPVQSFTPDATHIECTENYDELAISMKVVLGMFKSLLVFLNHSGWICSINTEDTRRDRSYNKHFFIPLQWHNTVETMSMLVTKQGSIALAVRDEIAIFYHGLDFEERVGFSEMMAKHSTRMPLKRGASTPV